jgi:hypothetical protein
MNTVAKILPQCMLLFLARAVESALYFNAARHENQGKHSEKRNKVGCEFFFEDNQTKQSTHKKLEVSTVFLVPNLVSFSNNFVDFEHRQTRALLFEHPVCTHPYE